MPNQIINRRITTSQTTREPFSFGKVTQYLSGVVGNEMVDISGNGYNADIINKDFYINGIPYKSVAMIAQKAANYGLIPDNNNFWFTSGGVPNQIPVVSLYTNIDYANQTFCKHVPQSLDSSGIEIVEPFVYEIVTYSSALTGVNLTNANSYFNVTSAVVGAKYVPGDYANNTLAIAAVSAGATIYNKTGIKTETTSLIPNKSLFIRGIGFSVNNFGGAPTNLVFMSGGATTVERLTLSGAGTVTRCFRINSNNCVVNSVKVYNIADGDEFFRECSTGLTVSNSVFIGTTQTYFFQQTAPNLLFTGCYISGSYSQGIFGSGATNTETQTVQYCRILTTNALQVNCPALVFNFNYNTVTINNLGVSSDVFRMTSAGCTLNVKYNTITGTGTTATNGAWLFNSFPATGNFNFEYNNYTTADRIGLFVNCATSNNSVIRGNIISLNKSSISFVAVSGSSLIENNLVITNGTGGTGNITNVNYGSATGLTNKSITVQKNRILSAKYFNSSNPGYHNCIYYSDYVNTITKYNWVAGAGTFNIIIKCTTAMDNTECPCIYNISYLNGLLCKGQGYVKFYNNTIVDANPAGITIQGADDLSGPKTCYVKNNIIVNGVDSSPLVDIIAELVGFEHQINYNVYYSTSATPFKYLGVSKTFAQWQALGYDVNSIMLTSDQFNNLFEGYSSKNFQTKNSYLFGENLGASYDTGLDITTDWGSDAKIPVVVTKQQGSAWQCGAYVK